MATPKKNIEWNKVPATACIEDRGKYYVAHMGRTSAVVFWGSQDARQAQATLWALAQGSKNQRICGDLFRKTRPLPGLRGARRRRRK
jgi:hypothetical protein